MADIRMSQHPMRTFRARRALRVRPSAVAAMDGVVLTARNANRLGQRVLDDVTVLVVGQARIPTAPTITLEDAAFLQPSAPGLFIRSSWFDVAGVLVPTGAGAWRLNLRSVRDLTLR